MVKLNSERKQSTDSFFNPKEFIRISCISVGRLHFICKLIRLNKSYYAKQAVTSFFKSYHCILYLVTISIPHPLENNRNIWFSVICWKAWLISVDGHDQPWFKLLWNYCLPDGPKLIGFWQLKCYFEGHCWINFDIWILIESFWKFRIEFFWNCAESFWILTESFWIMAEFFLIMAEF